MAQPKIDGVGHGKPVMPFGSDGTNWYAILVDALGHIQADIVSSGLPSDAATQTTLAAILAELAYKLETGDLSIEAATKYLNVVVKTCALPSGAATETTLASALTALQLIDDLRNALGSVNTDDLQVDVKTYPGVNALLNIPFGYYDRYAEALGNLSATLGNNFLYGTVVPAGQIWVVTAVNIFNNTTAAGTTSFGSYDGATYFTVADSKYLTPTRVLNWGGSMFAKAGDKFYGYFSACEAGDDIYVRFMGYKMKVA